MGKRIVVVIVCILSVIACLTSYLNYNHLNNEMISLTRQIADVENKIAAKAAKNQDVKIEVLSALGGIDERRVNEDAEIFGELFEVAFTWSSYEEYEAMRRTLVHTYGFSEDCHFLTDVWGYIPPAEEGNDYASNYIDANGIKIEYGSSKAYLIGISGTDYYYFGKIDWRVCGEEGGTWRMSYGFTATTDIDGNVKDLFVMGIIDT